MEENSKMKILSNDLVRRFLNSRRGGEEKCRIVDGYARKLLSSGYSPCTRVSVVYENFCTICNQEARGGQEAKTVEDAPPSIYIGETSRSIQESALEHQPDLRNTRERSHNKHRVLHHEDKETPFMMKVVSFHKSALSRQAAEAVRIRRRGGEKGLY